MEADGEAPDRTNLNWTEEGLFKLPCKELKKLARQSNVNANFKKADLVKALLDVSMPTVLEERPKKANESNVVRLTRSKSSIFQPLSEMTDNHSKPDLQEHNIQLLEEGGIKIMNDNKRKVKQAEKSEKNTEGNIDDLFKIESSVNIKRKSISGGTKATPLSEITIRVGTPKNINRPNSYAKSNTDPKSINITGNENINDMNKETKDKMQRGNKASKKNNVEVTKQLDENVSFNYEGESKDDLNSFNGLSNVLKANKETGKKSKRLGRKKKGGVDDNENSAEDFKPKDEIITQSFNSSVCNDNKITLEKLKIPLNETDEVEEQENTSKRQKRKVITKDNKIQCQSKTEEDHEIEIKLPIISDKRSTPECIEKSKIVTASTSDSSGEGLQTKNKRRGRKIKHFKESDEREHISSDIEENISISLNNNKIGTIIRRSVQGPSITPPTGIEKDTSIATNKNITKTNKSSKQSSSRKSSYTENECSLKSIKSHEEPQEASNNSVDSIQSNDNPVTSSPQGALKRSNTFTVDSDKDSVLSNEIIPSSQGALKRSNTFTIDSDKDTVQSNEIVTSEGVFKRSNTFTIDSDKGQQDKFTPRAKGPKIENSIGNRILSSTKKLKSGKVLTKHNSGSSLKKIEETAKTPGSSYKSKFGISKTKVPNYKSIHQNIFKKMESVGDYQKRKLDRAQALLCSPIVPKCATLYKTPKRDLKDNNDLIKAKGMSSKTQSARKLSHIDQPKIPAAREKLPVTGSSVNRFGFRNQINKVDAKRVIGNKLPPVSMEKKREEERSILKGVRMNKRFRLQMQMREKYQDK